MRGQTAVTEQATAVVEVGTASQAVASVLLVSVIDEPPCRNGQASVIPAAWIEAHHSTFL